MAAPIDLSVTPAPGVRHQRDRKVKSQLYGKHGVPCYWMVDAEDRVIQAFESSGVAYRPVGTLQGRRPVGLPPFPDLSLDPAAIQP
jgi:Uma2 family endonuclease